MRHAPPHFSASFRQIHEPLPAFNLVDRALAACGLYGWAVRRASARYAYDLQRWYLDAAKIDRITGNWGKIGAYPDLMVEASAKTARDRARFLVSNCGYAARAKAVLVDCTVGTGITTQCQIAYSRDDTENQRLNQRAEDRKAKWMDQADAGGRLHWYEIQQLALGQVIECGEVLLQRRYLSDSGRVLPLAYDVIECDRLASYLAQPLPGNEIIQGVEVDTNGRPVAYHVESGTYALKVTRIPADQCLHLYRMDRPGQTRGLTWFAPAIPDLHMLRDVVTYALISRKVQSAISVLVHENPRGGAMPAIPGLGPRATDSATTTNAGDPKRFLEPGMITKVGTGDVTPFVPAQSQDLDALTKLILRAVGVSFGLSYEWLAGDYSQVTFASGRLADQHTWRRMLPVHDFLCRRLEAPVHRSWLDAELTFGETRRPPATADAYAVRFSRPRREWGINPVQEVSAATQAVSGFLSTYRDEIENRGGDWQEYLTQRAKEDAFMSKLGLAVDTALGPASGGATNG